VFRALTATDEGISITDFPVNINEGFSAERILTFDPNIRPNTVYYYYVREVLEEAQFDAASVTLIPEVLGPPSARIRIETPEELPWMNENEADEEITRGFVMMFIGNELMNVNNGWEEIDPGRGTVPIIESGRTMVPIRAIVEAMNGTAEWDGDDRRIDLTAQGNAVAMWLGRTDILVNNSEALMDIAPNIVNGRTLLPLRFVAQNLGAHIEWIASQQMVVIVYEID
jgi:hypothetical protein